MNKLSESSLEGCFDLVFFYSAFHLAHRAIGGVGNLMYKEYASQSVRKASEDGKKTRMMDAVYIFDGKKYLYFENSMLKGSSVARKKHTDEDNAKLLRTCVRSIVSSNKTYPVALHLGEEDGAYLSAHQMSFVNDVYQWTELFRIAVPLNIQNIDDGLKTMEHCLALALYVKNNSKSNSNVIASDEEQKRQTIMAVKTNNPKTPGKHKGSSGSGGENITCEESIGGSSRVITGTKQNAAPGDKHVVLKSYDNEELYMNEMWALVQLERAGCHGVVPRVLDTFLCCDLGRLIVMRRYYTLDYEQMSDNAAECTAFVAAACRIVDSVHACNVSHGDIKPDHFMWDDHEGCHVLMDFDCAKHPDYRYSDGFFTGTPGWVYEGSPIRCGRDGDLIALGSLFGWLVDVEGCGDASSDYEHAIMCVDRHLDGLDASDWRYPICVLARDLLYKDVGSSVEACWTRAMAANVLGPVLHISSCEIGSIVNSSDMGLDDIGSSDIDCNLASTLTSDSSGESEIVQRIGTITGRAASLGQIVRDTMDSDENAILIRGPSALLA